MEPFIERQIVGLVRRADFLCSRYCVAIVHDMVASTMVGRHPKRTWGFTPLLMVAVLLCGVVIGNGMPVKTDVTILQKTEPPYPEFKILVLYSNTVEPDHVDFKNTALVFFKQLQEGREFDMDTSADMQSLCTKKLSDYSLVIMLNDFPHTQAQRSAFENYMEHGGGWLGFHVAGYNDKSTSWPWFVHFLGGAVFYTNSWPPVPAKLIIDTAGHPVTKTLPASFMSPSNEWYNWKPSPRLDSNVQVLISLSPENYPLGLKDILRSGDNPVVWTNKAYRMVYMNMGHGSAIFTDATQNKLIVNTFRWLVSRDPKGNVFN